MKKDSGTAKHEENTAKEKVAKERERESESAIVTWCKGIVGIGLFITVVKNIISGVTDVMIKTTFHGMNPITLVFLRYLHIQLYLEVSLGYLDILQASIQSFNLFKFIFSHVDRKSSNE